MFSKKLKERVQKLDSESYWMGTRIIHLLEYYSKLSEKYTELKKDFDLLLEYLELTRADIPAKSKMVPTKGNSDHE